METLAFLHKDKKAASDLKCFSVYVFQRLFYARIPPTEQQTLGKSVFSQKSPRIRVYPSSGPCFLSHKLHYQRMFADLSHGNTSTSPILSIMVTHTQVSVSYLLCKPLQSYRVIPQHST